MEYIMGLLKRIKKRVIYGSMFEFIDASSDGLAKALS